MLDHRPKEIIRFGKSFERQYLEAVREQAQNLKNVASNINDTLKGTTFANNSAEKVVLVADKILQVINQGEERTRELIKKAEEEQKVLDDFEKRTGAGR